MNAETRGEVCYHSWVFDKKRDLWWCHKCGKSHPDKAPPR